MLIIMDTKNAARFSATKTKTTKLMNNETATPETKETCDGCLSIIPKDDLLACSVCGVKYVASVLCRYPSQPLC